MGRRKEFPKFWKPDVNDFLERKKLLRSQPVADGLCLVVPELISVSTSKLLGWIMPGMEEASLNEVNQPINPLQVGSE